VTEGFVYFIQAEESLTVKIGFSQNPEKRLRYLQCGHSENLILIGSVAGTPSDERRLHKKLASNHKRGEWFKPTTAILLAIGSSLGWRDDMSNLTGEQYAIVEAWLRRFPVNEKLIFMPSIVNPLPSEIFAREVAGRGLPRSIPLTPPSGNIYYQPRPAPLIIRHPPAPATLAVPRKRIRFYQRPAYSSSIIYRTPPKPPTY
jgi:hypothetical protein